MTDVAVITVTHRSADGIDLWANALTDAWILAPAESSLQVIVVDNASDDATAAAAAVALPDAEVIRSAENIGFAAACNRGLEQVADHATVVLLNPDVSVASDFFATLAKMEWPADVAAIGPLVRAADGSIEQSARAFPSATTGAFGRTTLLSRLFPRARATQSQLLATPEDGGSTVDWVSGACLIARRETFRTVGPLDDGYWMYWEDADWCARATEQGYRVQYRPELRVTHRQGTSSATRPFVTTVAFHRSAARYYRRHVARHRFSAWLAGGLLAMRAGLKLLASAGQGLRRRARPVLPADQ